MQLQPHRSRFGMVRCVFVCALVLNVSCTHQYLLNASFGFRFPKGVLFYGDMRYRAFGSIPPPNIMVHASTIRSPFHILQYNILHIFATNSDAMCVYIVSSSCYNATFFSMFQPASPMCIHIALTRKVSRPNLQ